MLDPNPGIAELQRETFRVRERYLSKLTKAQRREADQLAGLGAFLNDHPGKILEAMRRFPILLRRPNLIPWTRIPELSNLGAEACMRYGERGPEIVLLPLAKPQLCLPAPSGEVGETAPRHGSDAPAEAALGWADLT